MSTYRRRSLLAFALGALLLLLLPAAAQAWRGGPIPIGDPIPADPPPGITLDPGSFELDGVRAADPAGGPPWGVGTVTARSTYAPGQQLVCDVVGRRVGGQLGRIDADGVFHPYAFGAGVGGCGGSLPGRRTPSTADFIRLSQEPAAPCLPGGGVPTVPACDPAIVRTIRVAMLGESVLSARVQWDGRSRPVPMSRQGTLLLALPGVGSAQFDAPIAVRIQLCGPRADRELVEWLESGGTPVAVRGCVGMFTLPLW
jgi:hypothetical protein